MAKTVTWVCVADAGHVRIKRSTSGAPSARLTKVTTLYPDESYEHGVYEAPQGVSQESSGTGRHGMDDAEGPIRRDKRQFARTVADYLREQARRGAFHRLVLAAPPQFLGDLREALDESLRRMVSAELPKDLTKLSDAELKKRLGDIAYGV